MMQQMHERERLYHLDKPGVAPSAVAPLQAPGLPPGWIALQDCNISPVPGRPMPVPYVLLHPELGVALVDIAPAETLHAEEAFRARLEAARFAAIFPGHLPILHLLLQPGELTRLATLLPDAFAGQPPVSLPGGDGWVSVVRRALAPRHAMRSAPRPGAAPSEAAEPPALSREVAAHRVGASGAEEAEAHAIPLDEDVPARRRLALPAGLGIAGLAAAAAVVFMLRAEPEPAASTPERTGASEPAAARSAAGSSLAPKPDPSAQLPAPAPDRLATAPMRAAAPRPPEPTPSLPRERVVAAAPAVPGMPPAVAAAANGGPHVVVRAAANLRAAPDKKSAVLRIVPQGEVLREFSRGTGGWVEVGDTRPQGWIYDKLVETAKP